MKVEKFELANKLRLLTVPDKNSNSVSVLVLVGVGSRYEEKSVSGLAHFVEHMFFKGTKKRPTSKDIAMAMEKIGGSSNAFTSHDYTGYYIKTPKEQFDKALEIMADMIQNGLFRIEEIERERGVIIEEIRMYEDRPMNKVRQVWLENFFGDTPLGRDIAGSIDTVSNMTQANFKDFVKNEYTGENMVVAIAGGIESEYVRAKVEERFNNLKIGEKTVYEKYSKKVVEPSIHNLCKPIEQSHLFLGTYGHERSYKNRYALSVANTILSEGFGSRLFQEIRDKLGLAYYVYAGFDSFDEIGVFNIGMGVENSKVNSAVEAVMTQLREVINGKFDDEELERAKNYMLGSLITEMEASDEIAAWHGLQELLLEKVETIDEVKKEIEKIDREIIVQEMHKVFDGQSMLLASVSPHKNLSESLKDSLVI